MLTVGGILAKFGRAEREPLHPCELLALWGAKSFTTICQVTIDASNKEIIPTVMFLFSCTFKGAFPKGGWGL